MGDFGCSTLPLVAPRFLVARFLLAMIYFPLPCFERGRELQITIRSWHSDCAKEECVAI
jgi:hypothetical protein